MARLSIRIDFEPSGSALGPGMAELLERIGQDGSIRKAAIAMNMSYRKAWLLLQGLHRTFGGPVVVTETGGAAGGGVEDSICPLWPARSRVRAAGKNRRRHPQGLKLPRRDFFVM